MAINTATAMPDALVLAGGFGTRLRAVVADVPKPMAPVAGRPFLELLLTLLARQGVQRAVLSLGHMAGLVQAHFGRAFAGMEIVCETEPVPLGTGGAIRRCLAHCRGSAALVVNGDTLLDLDLPALHGHWAQHRRPVIIGRQEADTSRYGRLQSEGGRLTGFAEKGAGGPGVINTGHYLLPTGLFDGHALPEAFSFESDFLVPKVQALGFDLVMTTGRFIDIGVPEDYARAQTELADLAQLAAPAS